MSLVIYNTLSRRKEPFEPIEPGKVRMYVCGITAYNYFHVGNARVFVVFDVVRRYLIWRGYQVRYVQNFTDIDDKILKRAIAENSTMQEVAERFIAAYFEDADRLNILRADSYPRATHTIDGIQRLIHELEQTHYAYAAGGDVYYSVHKFSEYGKLSGRRLEDMQAGASGRVDVEEESDKKKDPFDFALWKAAKPGEPAWESPWGAGRPGWHIECSAMVRQELGESIDIHAGGMDLTFPHHENEIAQSEAVTHQPLARFWMHNGFVNMDGEKMSKSLGNIRLTRDLLKEYDPMAFRLFVLQAHYRKPIDFTSEGLEAAASGWKTLKEALQAGVDFARLPGWSTTAPSEDLDQEAVRRFNEAMDDDFNTPIALSVLFELAKDLRREGNQLVHQGKPDMAVQPLQQKYHTLTRLAQVLGLESRSVEAELLVSQPGMDASTSLTDADIETLIQQRQEARQAKNWAESDRIRNELQAQGITLIDSKDGTRWHRS
ncbi:cysteine--tRNA ligase [Leptothermofonsia sichuanensis E412]|uniref:cysteine--tRNA ligase n=1 Tax=Leptothermofonsia sichuanensis TaxID=2917832 RepID=UPI001CA7096A|nr:cysteine--tRNA ligase [Leptothermofonsia sichuanensis]QZZ23013.1 cysteine--tRNA ligase [Leptothermofonsia sichuanensis E412]